MTPALSVSNLIVRYGGIEAVKTLSFHVPAGGTVSLIGANGSGKTSIMRAISGLVPGLRGSIKLFGEELVGRRAARIARLGIAHVPEGRELFPRLTVGENLRMGGIALASSKFREREEVAFGMFPRLKERRNQLAGLLSGGEQQMVAIGRAIISEPRLLLLDEPSMGLAPNLVEDIFDAIVALKKAGTTILLVEQNAAKALAISDYSYVLGMGRVETEGRSRDLISDPRVVAAYLGGM